MYELLLPAPINSRHARWCSLFSSRMPPPPVFPRVHARACMQGNIRGLLGSLEQVLWAGHTWTPLSVGDLLEHNQVRVCSWVARCVRVLCVFLMSRQAPTTAKVVPLQVFGIMACYYSNQIVQVQVCLRTLSLFLVGFNISAEISSFIHWW